MIAVECSSREPRQRRLTPRTTTLTTPMNILKTNCTRMIIVQTNVHQLTGNSLIINTPRNTVKKPRPALNAHGDLPTLATIPLDHVKTHKMEFNMFNMDRNSAKEYEEYVEYEEHKVFDEEFNTDREIAKGHITSHGEVLAPRLWILGGYNQDEFQAFTHQWSLYRGCYSGMNDIDLRYQLLDSINGPLEDAMYDIFGDKIYTISDTLMLEELEKVAVKEIIAKSVNYSTKISEVNPVKLPPAQRSTAHSSPAHSSPALSKSKKIAVKQPPAHSSPALSKSKKIAVKQPPAHSSPAKQPPVKFQPPASAQALATLGLPNEDTHGPAAGGGAEKVHLYIIPARRPAPRPGIGRPTQDLTPEDQHILADSTSSVRADSTSTVADSTSTVTDNTSSVDEILSNK
jgi:hypothetical protein